MTTPELGVEATGIDPTDRGSREPLRQLLLEHGALVLHGLDLDAEGVVAVASALGTPLRHPPHPAYPDLPEIAPIANDEARGRLASPYWHTDGLLRPDPPCLTVFYAADVPDRGGETLLQDGRRAFAELEPEDRETLEGLVAVFGTGTTAPLVRSHPVTGVPALAVNTAGAVGIEGVTRESAARLIAGLAEHLNRPERIFTFRPRRGDLVIWDNWSVVHSATPPPPPLDRRLMLRADVHAWKSY